MSDRVCQHHSGIDIKLDNIENTLKSVDERLKSIQTKVEPITVIGRMADDNRSWLRWLTGGIVTAFMFLMGWK
jgi:hypothetical protein